MVIIPLIATPSQKLSVLLAKQNCQISVFQKTTGLYIDLSVNNAPIVQANLCMDRVAIASDAYLGFVGNLRFIDSEGALDPVYSGLGSRYYLVYE